MALWLPVVGGWAANALGSEREQDRALRDEVARMARIGSCGSPSFSPNGAELVVVCDLSGTPQVWKVSADGGWPILLTPFEDQVEAVSWSPTGRWLAVSVAPGGGLNQQIYLVRPDGSELRRITDGSRHSHWLGPWTLDGRYLAYASNRRTPAAVDAYLYDVESGTETRLAENPGIGFLVDTSGDGHWASLWRMRGRGDSDLYLVDRRTGAEAYLTPHEGSANINGGIFAARERALYLLSNEDRDRTALVRLPFAANGLPGEPEIVAARDDSGVSGFAVTEDGELAALIWNVAGRSELELVDLETRERLPVPPLPAEIAGSLVFSRDGTKLAATFSGATRPQDVWMLDRGQPEGGVGDGSGDDSGGSWIQVTHSPHPGVDLSQLVRPELVRYEAHDGLELSGWLYRPQGSEDLPPYVLSFHGGPESQERPRFRSAYQALLSRGIGVFAPNVRGSSGFGKRFLHLDDREKRFDGVRDIESSVRYLVDSGLADPERLGILGGSYGGYMVMAGLTEYPELLAAGANLFGVVNFETFFEQTEPWMAAVSTTEYGDPETQRELLRRLSPIHKVDRVTAPTLVLHGANDTNVPVVEAEQVVESLRQREVPVKYVLFPDEGHGFRKIENRITSTVEIVRWFEEHLGVERTVPLTAPATTLPVTVDPGASATGPAGSAPSPP